MINYKFDYDTLVMHVEGNPEDSYEDIRTLMNEGYVPNHIRAIWFTSDIIHLFVGIYLPIYLGAGVNKPEKIYSFTEIIKSSG